MNGLLESMGCFAWISGAKKHGLFRITVRNTDTAKIEQVNEIAEYFAITHGIMLRIHVTKTNMVWHTSERTNLMRLIEYCEAHLQIPKKNIELVKQKLIEHGVIYTKWKKK